MAAIFGSSGIHGSHPSALHCSGQPPPKLEVGMRRQRQKTNKKTKTEAPQLVSYLLKNTGCNPTISPFPGSNPTISRSLYHHLTLRKNRAVPYYASSFHLPMIRLPKHFLPFCLRHNLRLCHWSFGGIASRIPE